MAKRGIYNENTFRGRFKGNTDGRVSNPNQRDRWDAVAWGEKLEFCGKCRRFFDLNKNNSCPKCESDV